MPVALTAARAAARPTATSTRRRSSAPRPLAAAGSGWPSKAGAGAEGSDSQQLLVKEDIIDKGLVPTATGVASNLISECFRRLLTGGSKNSSSKNSSSKEEQLKIALRTIEGLAQTVALLVEQLAEVRRQRDKTVRRLQATKAELVKRDAQLEAARAGLPSEGQLED